MVSDEGGNSEASRAERTLGSIVFSVSRRPRLTLLLAGLLTAGAALYSQQTVRMNSDDSALISQDEPFRLEYQRFIDVFPQFDETTVIVITSDSIDLAEDAVKRMTDALAGRPELIETLYSPSADPFFEDHALLYMDEADLEDVIDRLAEAQPALTALAEDPSLRGLMGELQLSVEQLLEGEELPPGFARMADRISEVSESLLAGKPRRISWADEFLEQEGEVYRIIIVQGRKNFAEKISTSQLIGEIRGLGESLGLVPENGVRMRLTGMVPLAHDELETLQSGLAFAGALSLTLLTVILAFGVRSLRIIVSTLVTLLVSITWTTAWAMLSVGEFNLISAAFAVLMIGLGVDFAVHIGLRYEEEIREGLPVPRALERAGARTGPSVSLCALTSAIGFLSFVPTPYPGLGSLGIIAGGGMFISLIATFSVFPALLALMRAPTAQQVGRMPVLASAYPIIDRRAGSLVLAAVIIGVVSAAISSQVRFDFSTLSMRDPASESMLTLRDLQREEIVTDYSATVLADNAQEAERLAGQLEQLEVVLEARPPSWYVAGDQENKLLMIEDAAFFLESILYPPPPVEPPTDLQREEAVQALRDVISRLPPDPASDPTWQSARRLGGVLDRLAREPDPAAAARALEALVINDLEERIKWIGRAVTVEGVVFEDLPVELRRRNIAPDGRARIVALPTEDVRDPAALGRFVAAVNSVAAHATGRPAVEAGIGEVVVLTFRIAIGISFVLVFSLLVLTLKSFRDAVLVLLPITLAALMTTATGVLIDVPFNMTNVVVIPLIMGLGIDNGIHVFMRFRSGSSLEEMMLSSTPRAVLLSALTTLAAFGSLAVSGHPGLHSIGVLLSFSVIYLIFCTLVVLPAMLALRARRRAAGRA
jgi:hopanoid biosynthesis associated RND transporter like protein HpnN